MSAKWGRCRIATRRRDAEKRTMPGNGVVLRPFRWWQQASRVLLYLPLKIDGATPVVYAIDAHYWHQLLSYDGRGKAALYLNGMRLAESRLPASFPVAGGGIEVVSAAFGLSRCHWVNAEGREHPLMPDRASAAGRRARLQRDHPMLTRRIGAVSLVVLFIPAAFLVIQLAELMLNTPPALRGVEVFDALPYLPAWLNTVFGIVVSVAGTERVIRFRHGWLSGLPTPISDRGTKIVTESSSAVLRAPEDPGPDPRTRSTDFVRPFSAEQYRRARARNRSQQSLAGSPPSGGGLTR
jgi:hypothetical protein